MALIPETMKEKVILKTPKQQEKEARDKAIYTEWKSLTSKEENSKMAVAGLISDKYNISLSTVWKSIERHERRIGARV